MHIGPDNSLVRSSSGDDDAAAQALIQHEAQRASMFSMFAVDIIERIRERYGVLSRDASWFENEFIDAATARRITKSVELDEAGEFDAAASVLAPRLEKVVRRLASSAGIPVTRSPDRGGRSGGVKGLGEILSLLEGILPKPTRRFLRVLLVEPTGLNLRNRIGHGLDDEIGQREMALLIQAACHLRLLQSGPPSPDPRRRRRRDIGARPACPPTKRTGRRVAPGPLVGQVWARISNSAEHRRIPGPTELFDQMS